MLVIHVRLTTILVVILSPGRKRRLGCRQRAERQPDAAGVDEQAIGAAAQQLQVRMPADEEARLRRGGQRLVQLVLGRSRQ